MLLVNVHKGSVAVVEQSPCTAR